VAILGLMHEITGHTSITYVTDEMAELKRLCVYTIGCVSLTNASLQPSRLFDKSLAMGYLVGEIASLWQND